MVRVITTQPVLENFTRHFDIIGPDTLLYSWQKARYYKNWNRADDLREVARNQGWELSFLGSRYEVQQKMRLSMGLWT